MADIFNKSDELTRRHFMSATAQGLLGVGLLPAASWAADLSAGSTLRRKPTARNVIYLYMSGGMTHLDTFDPKPGHENGGPVKAIPTSADGVMISEYLPLLAGHMDKAAIVRSLVSTRSEALGFSMPQNKRLHVHLPAGAVPKDGPSAGVTMTTALVSLLTGRLVRSDLAMTGEVTLGGRVLPIGGVKQKVLAAHRAGLTTVILPAENGKDLDDIPEEVREAMTIELVDDVDRLLEIALSDQVTAAA